MKIEKGHYVPKELITSEAIHKLIVMCFEAAGGVNDGVLGQYTSLNHSKGLIFSFSGKIAWLVDGNPVKPLTLQELLTAENSIQWPEWARDVRLNQGGSRAYFTGTDLWQFVDDTTIRDRSGDNPDHIILATRKPAVHIDEQSTLPAIGSKCEVIGAQDGDDYYPCTIVGHDIIAGIHAAVFRIDNYRGKKNYYSACTANNFRPLQTDREKFIEAVYEILCSTDNELEQANRLYDSGLFQLTGVTPDDKP